MKKKLLINTLIDKLGGKFSSSLGIDVSSQRSEEIFKWFLASIFFGARISETIAVRTYKEFEKDGVIFVDKILVTGWDGLVSILDRGGYVRYDFKTATKLLEIMGNLKDNYRGDLNLLHKLSSDSKDLEKRIQNLGKGIGKVTTGIFLRELRGVWEKADPPLTPLVFTSAKNLGLVKNEGSALKELKFVWEQSKIKKGDFVNFEAALLRLGRDFCRKRKCKTCLVKKYCINPLDT